MPDTKPRDNGDAPPETNGSDPAELAKNAVRLISEGGKVLSGVVDKAKAQGGPYGVANELGEAAKIFGSHRSLPFQNIKNIQFSPIFRIRTVFFTSDLKYSQVCEAFV